MISQRYVFSVVCLALLVVLTSGCKTHQASATVSANTTQGNAASTPASPVKQNLPSPSVPMVSVPDSRHLRKPDADALAAAWADKTGIVVLQYSLNTSGKSASLLDVAIYNASAVSQCDIWIKFGCYSAQHKLINTETVKFHDPLEPKSQTSLTLLTTKKYKSATVVKLASIECAKIIGDINPSATPGQALQAEPTAAREGKKMGLTFDQYAISISPGGDRTAWCAVRNSRRTAAFQSHDSIRAA